MVIFSVTYLMNRPLSDKVLDNILVEQNFQHQHEILVFFPSKRISWVSFSYFGGQNFRRTTSQIFDTFVHRNFDERLKSKSVELLMWVLQVGVKYFKFDYKKSALIIAIVRE